MFKSLFFALGLTAWLPLPSLAQTESQFPATPRVLVDGVFQRCEGIAFNGEGDLYVAGNSRLWRVSPAGEATEIAELYSNLGLAPIGDRDILMADFGPTSRFDTGPNADGFVSGAVGHPNGLALSADESMLYIAQIFKSIRPIVSDGRVWALPFTNGMPSGPPELIADLGDEAANDGLAMDELGRIYVAANGAGQIWRIDPETRETKLIAENMPGAASIAFGEGEFDQNAIYVTSTRTGKVWEVQVGVGGATLHR